VTDAAIVTIGNFDGGHLGHQMLIRQVVDRANALQLRSYAVTFDPHPEQVLFPERKLAYLTSAAERSELLREYSVDEVWVCTFTPEIARLEPEEFMRLVTDRQPIAELWVGADFALGRGRTGTLAVLAEIGSIGGWALHMVPQYRKEGQVVSSTAIRTLLGAGAVRGAADLLGRAYRVTGELIGSGELQVDESRVVPRPGPYEAQLHQNGHTADAVATVLPIIEGRVAIQYSSTPLPPGRVNLDFVRRAD
jgi:riboflavin kinase/FMN adenylyltransferase